MKVIIQNYLKVFKDTQNGYDNYATKAPHEQLHKFTKAMKRSYLANLVEVAMQNTGLLAKPIKPVKTYNFIVKLVKTYIPFILPQKWLKTYK